MTVRRGQVMTPRRRRLIHAYTRRHMWVHQAFYDGKWTREEYLAFKQWEKEFGRWITKKALKFARSRSAG
jgi:hypothetical protein